MKLENHAVGMSESRSINDGSVTTFQCLQEHSEILGLPVPPALVPPEGMRAQGFHVIKLQSQASVHKHAWDVSTSHGCLCL